MEEQLEQLQLASAALMKLAAKAEAGGKMEEEEPEPTVVILPGGKAPIDRDRLCNDILNTGVTAALVGGFALTNLEGGVDAEVGWVGYVIYLGASASLSSSTSELISPCLLLLGVASYQLRGLQPACRSLVRVCARLYVLRLDERPHVSRSQPTARGRGYGMGGGTQNAPLPAHDEIRNGCLVLYVAPFFGLEAVTISLVPPLTLPIFCTCRPVLRHPHCLEGP